MVQIFISYNRDDRPFVDQLLPLIRKVYGKDSVWFDEDIHGGAEWWELILKEIGRSTLFIYLISNESLESAYCQAEMREALRLGIPILPIIIRRLKPPYPGRIEPELAEILSKLHYIDISAGIKNKLEKIAEMYAALHQLLTQETRSTPPPIATLPTPKPVVLTPKAKLPDVYVTGLFGVLIAVIAGVFGLWQGWFTQQSPLPTATPTTAIALAVTSSMTPTLTGFQELQTVQAVQSAQAETEVALGLTQTEARISSDNSTAMAAMFAPTETAARLTLIALSATATPTPTPDPFNPISRNADWTPVTAVFGGVTMVLVPAGEFEMGSTEEEIDAGLAMCQAAADNNATCNRAGLEDERMGGDNTQVFSEPFWIDQTEVTRGQYQACVAAGVCSETPDNGFSTEPEQPINQVTWFQAEAYCAWREARLPTEAEWEYAARGPDRWVFPWGDTFDGTRANHCDRNCGEASWSSGYNYVNEENEDGHAVTAPVGSYPLGQSWVGALDLAGNVWEWTSSLYQPYPYDRNDGREADMGSRTDVRYTLRGGSFGSSTYLLRGAARDWLSPNIEDFNIGFRCARSYQ